jgi:hypothetical protein
MTDITPIIELIVTVLAALCSIVIIPYIKTRLNRAQLDKAVQWVEIAVNAAEEAARTGLIEKGAKYGYAVELLERNGITFDAATTQALVDATVWQLFNQFRDDAEA